MVSNNLLVLHSQFLIKVPRLKSFAKLYVLQEERDTRISCAVLYTRKKQIQRERAKKNCLQLLNEINSHSIFSRVIGYVIKNSCEAISITEIKKIKNEKPIPMILAQSDAHKLNEFQCGLLHTKRYFVI